MARGPRLIAGEEEEGTLDLLATMPVSRRLVLVEKGAALALSLGVLAFVLFASTWVSSLVFGLDISLVAVLNGTMAMFLIGLEFGLVALSLSAGTGRRGLATGVTAGIAGAVLSHLPDRSARRLDTTAAGALTVLSGDLRRPARTELAADRAGSCWPSVSFALAASVPIFEHRDLAI